jgi:hypothetical protein
MRSKFRRVEVKLHTFQTSELGAGELSVLHVTKPYLYFTVPTCAVSLSAVSSLFLASLVVVYSLSLFVMLSHNYRVTVK